VWRGHTLNTLLEHLELADYNRQLVSWKLEDSHFRNFVLLPQIDPAFDGSADWRRPLWEFFYPRVRRETDPLTAADILQRNLHETVLIARDARPASIVAAWETQTASPQVFESIYVAALRSVGIPARLNDNHQAEILVGAQWETAPETSASQQKSY